MRSLANPSFSRYKRLLALGVCAAVLCSLTSCAGVLPEPSAPENRTDGVEQRLETMTLREKLAQMMFFSPRTWRKTPDAEGSEGVIALNGEMRRYLAEHRFGGLLLFGENCVDAAQLRRLTAELCGAACAEGGIRPFIAMDQEGGEVVRLSFGTAGPGNMALAATGDPGCARRMAEVYGEELSLLGIHVDFAPVLDVNDNPANPVIGLRSFGDEPLTAGQFGVAYLQGLQSKGVVACAKHFPGHGNTDTDSHTGLPLVNRSLDELRKNELIPFQRAVEAGVDMVMTAHIQFPQVEERRAISLRNGEEICLPATMSPRLLTEILRRELGFEGVVVSDALDMKAIWDNFSRDDMLALSISAGVDMLILPCGSEMDTWSIAEELLDRAEALVKNGVIEAGRIDDSVRRILKLKQKYGLLDRGSDECTEEMLRAAAEGCGSEEHRRIAWDISVKALTLWKNENHAFPLELKPGEKTLILFSDAGRLGAGDLSRQLLKERNVLPEGTEIQSLSIQRDNAPECLRAAGEADHVLIVSRVWSAECLDAGAEEGFPAGVIRQVIAQAHFAGKAAVLISAQLPYDAACFPEADAILLCYGSSPMRGIPNLSGPGSAWMPNLPAAICAAFGLGEPGGALPVDLPAPDSQEHLTRDILGEEAMRLHGPPTDKEC